ncbi:hypothetical protein SDC9_197065 [bioreactor metagenome]|uniref:Uncharacterized protein n=1 Tax=bioreactor metagenome TaxID=1076179 RepID=A0A645IMA9_9ZZZZ
MLISPAREKTCQTSRHSADWHGLKRDFPWTSDHRIENALTAEDHILDARDRYNLNGTGVTHRSEVAGVNNHGLAGCKLVFADIAINLDKGGSPAGQPLHDEALAAEKAGGKLLLKEDRQFHAGLACKKSALLDD